MTLIGSANFCNIQNAIRYYKPYGLSVSDVIKKIKNKEIHIGPPAGDFYGINNEGRYLIKM